MWSLRASFVMLALLLGLSGGAFAQAQDNRQSSVLTVDAERLFSDSAFGAKIALEFEKRRADLVAEGLIIQSRLEDEESALVEKRKTLPADEFRALADAFDAKVQDIRAEQDAKAQQLNQSSDQDRLRFLRAAQPVLEQIMRDYGAVVILDQRSVFLRIEEVDITDEAIERIDEILTTDDLVPDVAPAPAAPEDPPSADKE